MTKVVQEIQYVLAPAIMVSSAALFLLGFQAKFSSLAGRFRTLNQERRTLAAKASRTEEENERLRNLSAQVDHLYRRATFVKSAILLTYGSIVCFVITSILLFVSVHTTLHFFRLTMFLFLTGLALILSTAIIMMVEITLAFKVVTLEKASR
jgi:hypothetical protein